MTKAAIIVGSLREDSQNLKLGLLAERIFREEKGATTDLIVPDLPLFSQDLERKEKEPKPDKVREFRKTLREADVLFVAAPEYDRLPNAIILNACHWASRGPNRPLEGTPTLLSGASSGLKGTRSSRDALRLAFERIGADVIGADIFVGPAREVFASKTEMARLENEVWEKISLLLKQA